MDYNISFKLFWEMPEDVRRTYPVACRCNGKEVFNPNFGYQSCGICGGDGRIVPKRPEIPSELRDAVEKTIEEFFNNHFYCDYCKEFLTNKEYPCICYAR